MSSNDDQFDDGLEDFDDVAVDEFGNDIEPGEETFAGEEDWDSYDEQDEGAADDQPQAQTGKKSGNFNKIVIGLAVLAGVGVLFFQLSQGPSSTPAPAPAPVPAPVVAVTPAPAPAAPPASGFLTSPENMAALEQDIAKTYSDTEVAEFDETGTKVESAEHAVAPPMPTAMTQDETSGMDDLAPAQPAVPAAPPAAEQAIRMPNAAEVLLKQPSEALPEQQAVVPASPAPAAATPAAAPTSETSSEIISKIDLVLARLDQLEGDVKMLKAREAGVSAAAIADLKESLAALEKKVSVAAKAPAKASAPAPEEDSRPPKPQILGASPAPAAVPKAVAPQVAPKTAAVRWVLKGAQPGRAMVSRPGESEMRNVAVGDTLPGIGRITGISYQDGRWLVQGTEGRITQ